jgi:alpha-galactosidase
VWLAGLILPLTLFVGPTRAAGAPTDLARKGEPVVIRTKAVRIEAGARPETLWSFAPLSAAPPLSFAPPVFPLDGKAVSAAPSRLRKLSGPENLPNGVYEYVVAGPLAEDPSLALEIRFRVSDHSPVVRFRYRLTGDRPRRLTRSGDEDEIVYLRTSFAGLPRATEVRLSEFVAPLHSYRLTEREVAERDFESRLGIMGPILLATDGRRSALVAYEHGSQSPDAFIRYDLGPGRSVVLRAVKGSYWSGLTVDRDHPLDTVWLEAALAAGDETRMAESFRTFVGKELSTNPATRAPRTLYDSRTLGGRALRRDGERALDLRSASRVQAEIDAAARMGVETFVLGSGWLDGTGDRAAGPGRSPEGLAPLMARLDAHGMKLGLRLDPTATTRSGRAYAANRAYAMSWKGETRPWPGGGTGDGVSLCLVSPWGEALIDDLVRLHRETGVTYFRWDGVGQYGCDAPGHGHGTAANSREERAQAYAFRIGPRLAELAERLGERVEGAVVDLDATEAERPLGLAFLTAGRYVLGPCDLDPPARQQPAGRSPFCRPGPARTWITRSTYAYDRWAPSQLLWAEAVLDDPGTSPRAALASLVLGHDAIRGDLLSVPPESVERIGTLLGLWRQVRDSVEAAAPVRSGVVGGSGEVHEKIEHETGRGLIAMFSSVGGRRRYVSAHRVARPWWASAGTKVALDSEGRAVLDVTFESPGAALVFFGASAAGPGDPPGDEGRE